MNILPMVFHLCADITLAQDGADAAYNTAFQKVGKYRCGAMATSPCFHSGWVPALANYIWTRSLFSCCLHAASALSGGCCDPGTSRWFVDVANAQSVTVSAVEVDYRKLSLAKLGLVFGFAAHWMACFWQITSVLEDAIADEPYRWFTEYHHLRGSRPWQLYVTSLYWSVITMSTIGTRPGHWSEEITSTD
jgi:hypothetical protein